MIDYRQFGGHTPGPWTVGNDNGDMVEVVAGIFYIADCYSIDPDSDEVKANARLIAAAPDLLSENKRLRATLSKCHNRAHNPQEVKQIVREALQGVDND